MGSKLFLRKSIKSGSHDEAIENEHVLKRSLGPIHLIAIGVGAMIGAGLFILTGQAAADYAGPAVMISFIIAAVLCLFTALCYAELASLIPISGSAYSYSYVALGEFPAWIIGWVMTMGYLIAVCTVSVGWSGYLTSLLSDLHLHIPSFLASALVEYDVGRGVHFGHAIINLPALGIIFIVGALIAFGTRAAASFNNIMVFIKLIVIILFVVCGFAFIRMSNFYPFIPPNTGVFGQYGWSGILRGASVVFFAFIGFDALSTLSQEVHNPQKDVPVGMLGSLIICTLAYIIVAFILIGLVPYTQLNVDNPIAVAVNALGSGFVWLRIFIKIAILAGLTSVVLVMLLSQTRICFIMAHDGLLPKQFGRIHKTTHTPFFATWVLTIIGSVIAAFFPVSILSQLVSMALLLTFAIVCLGVLVLRVTHKEFHRTFKVPFVPVIPVLGAIFCIIQMFMLPLLIWIQLVIWVVIGCLVYFGYGARHSKVRHKANHHM